MFTQLYEPDRGARGLGSAFELVRQGHDVEVIAEQLHGNRVRSGRITRFRRELAIGVPVLRAVFCASNDGSAAKRMVNECISALALVIGALGVKRPDVAYVCHAGTAACFAAKVLKVFKSVPFVVYEGCRVRPTMETVAGGIENAPAFGPPAHRAMSAYSSSARIVVSSARLRDVLVSKGVSRAKMDVLADLDPDSSGDAQQLARVLLRASFLRPHVLLLKRIGDIVVSTLGLVVLTLPITAIAIAVHQKLGSPTLFRQMRPGRHGKLFELVKFRTMTDARDAAGQIMPDAERLTHFGRVLRSTSIDELPSLWNVLRGDISLVGPRPLLPRYTEYFTEEESLRLDVRPGITGLAQINGRNTSSWDSRLADDVKYVRSLTIGQDLHILWRTVARVFRQSGFVEDPESLMANLDVERSNTHQKASER